MTEVNVEDMYTDADLDTSHVEEFRLSIEQFAFSTPKPSAYHRSALLGIKRESSEGDILASPPPLRSVEKRALRTGDGLPRKSKRKRGYATPETYAHLDYLTDCLAEDLAVMFCGINPGVFSAKVGHHFAHPSNQFYRMLYGSGFTDRLIPASEDHTLPRLYSIGITDLVDRPSSGADELSDKEMIESVPAFLQKVVKYRPSFVCFIGKGMWLNVEKGLKHAIAGKGYSDSSDLGPSPSPGSKKSSTKAQTGVSPKKGSVKVSASFLDNGLGLRPYKVVLPDNATSSVRETLFFCSPSSSGLATNLTLSKKIELLKQLHEDLHDYKSGALDTSTMQKVPI